ncbi:ASF1B isoform 3 [Pan troglodytes]|uniref:Anti-silencing function 1B histone chaperone n=2 Tax=Homininae TaxID=207598 RepID=K7EM93_HUMAN|nr:ASF1B isoform 3 [Pan troglodytes]
MAKVSVLNVAVLENPSPFHSPFRFEISFECSEALADGRRPQPIPHPRD